MGGYSGEEAKRWEKPDLSWGQSECFLVVASYAHQPCQIVALRAFPVGLKADGHVLASSLDCCEYGDVLSIRQTG
jgi:hypothetical protein